MLFDPGFLPPGATKVAGEGKKPTACATNFLLIEKAEPPGGLWKSFDPKGLAKSSPFGFSPQQTRPEKARAQKSNPLYCMKQRPSQDSAMAFF